MATNAADIFGLQQKGRIAPGKMPTSSSFSRIAAMFLPMTIGISPQSQPVCWPYHWRAYHETILRGDVIYDIEQGFPVAPKVNLSLNISSNLAPAMPVLARAFSG